MNRKAELQHMGDPISKFSWNIMSDNECKLMLIAVFN